MPHARRAFFHAAAGFLRALFRSRAGFVRCLFGALGGGFGAFDTAVGGCLRSGGSLGAGFALFGGGCCEVDLSELQSKRRVVIIEHLW